MRHCLQHRVGGRRDSPVLREDGAIYWNQEAVTWPELERRIQTVKESLQPPRVFLMGERSVRLGVNLDVRGLLRGTDFVEVALKKDP
jgi:biopolymer transport protein ExbD